MTTTSLTLNALRRSGWLAALVERWVPHANIRVDLFGVGDVLAVSPAERAFLIVQCTTADNLAARVRKAQTSAELAVWLAAGGRFECWGWKKIEGRWRVRKLALAAEDLAAVEVQALPRPRRRRKGEQAGLFD